ncbi:MAG: fumarylacetoacetate hydrolase family protein [Flavobacteriales bacterium]|nr:fumarylacetoacetate hydrolase family protein [Flavobacteriales bacterium]
MKIICIGRNYALHAKELGNQVPDEPLVFLKPETALIPRGMPFFYPQHSKDVHFELELVVKINRVGRHIEERFAHRYYDSVGLGIDFTCRDLQKIAKEKGHPWEKAKAFDHSAPVSEKFIPLSELNEIQDIEFTLLKNDEIAQKGNSRDMLFSVDRLISEVSRFFTLKIGDLIFTGTPEGVGPVEIGDRLEGYIGNTKLLDIRIK